MIVTADDGASWQYIDCPDTSRSAGPPPRCEPVVAAGGDLWLRLHEASLDAGRTWREVSVAPDPGAVTVPVIDGVVALPDGG